MGTGIQIECGACGYCEWFSLGVGMMYGSLEAVKSLIPVGQRKKVMEILQNEEVRAADHYHALYACDKCHGLYGRFYVKIAYGKNQVFETVFRCPRCKVPLRDTEFTYEEEDEELPTLKTWPCPKCGKHELRVAEMMIWD